MTGVTVEPGVYFDLSNADYHGGEGVNKGLLDQVHRSPLHAKAALDAANDNDPTLAQIIGSAFHTLLLEPHKFADEYVVELTQADAPHAIADRDTLVAMVEELNVTRLAKLTTGGTKAEQIERILAATADQATTAEPLVFGAAELEIMKGADLKAVLEGMNKVRPGKYSISGSIDDLAEILRANGHTITLWRDVRARWAEENQGYTVLSVDQHEQLLAMAFAVHNHPAAEQLLAARVDAVAEASVYWTDQATGELCRCRPDYWRADGIIVDVKTTEDASQEGFSKSLASWRYHVQAPWYRDGLMAAYEAGHFPQGWAAPKAFVFLVVEKKAPHAVACYVIDAESIELGRAEYREDLDKLAECKATGIWPGYGDTLQMIGVPQWYLLRNAHRVDAA